MTSAKKYFSFILSALMIVLGSLEAEAVNISPIADNIHYYGRWKQTGDGYGCDYGAAYIKAKFSGASIKAHISGKKTWWKYSIDNGPFQKFWVNGSAVLNEVVGEGEHTIKLVRSTDTNSGVNVFKGFELEDNGKIMPIDIVSERSLEFIGDSITAGVANISSASGEWYDKEDNDEAYGPKLARMLGAEYSVEGKPGEGVFKNSGETSPYDDVHIADRYPWYYYSSNKSAKHDYCSAGWFQFDGVIIMSGTNDFYFETAWPEESAFIDSYYELIKTVRNLNNTAEIICIEPILCNENVAGQNWVRKAVEKANNDGDIKVHYISLNDEGRLLSPEEFADGIHPTKEGHEKVALFLKDRVASILGW